MSEKKDSNKFGMVKGVFIPSILTILGVVLFLRLGWVVGQAGIAATLIIIVLSSAITFLTGLSIAATATNTSVGSGGSYFLISRCFGPESGAAVGIPLYLAQALGVSFYSVGFAESLQLFFQNIPVPTVAFITLVILTGVTLISSDLALKTQTFILATIVLALLSFWFGHPFLAQEGYIPKEVPSASFWEVFAIFFPAVTGIEAGVSLSGDLKDPSKALPTGTIAAVLSGAVVYIISALVLNHLVPADVLMDNALILTEVALVPILIFIGLWGATLSSTMGALLGAPRTLQALAKDRVLPYFLSKGTEKNNEPRTATFVSFLLAMGGILMGDLNTIASVLSMFFLTSYGTLNLVAGVEGLIDNPSWRPTFKVSWVLSLLGAVLCFGAMFMISPGHSFVALAAIMIVYFVTRRRNIQSNYSDIRSGLAMYFARKFVYSLSRLEPDARNWRPNFLIFSGSPSSRRHLIDLADSISHQRGFMTVATALTSKEFSLEQIKSFESANREYLLKNRVEALTRVVNARTFKDAASGLIDNYGLGRISPNTIVLGDTTEPEKIADHVDIIQNAYMKHKNVVIVKDGEHTERSAKLGGDHIDVWWGGKKENKNLMLAMAYMLNTSPSWRGSDLTIKTVVKNEEGKEGISKNLTDFFKKSRIHADFEVYVASPEASVFSLITERSKKSDLVFMGLQRPDTVEDYGSYYLRIMEATRELKTVVFVLEAEKISFDEIFR